MRLGAAPLSLAEELRRESNCKYGRNKSRFASMLETEAGNILDWPFQEPHGYSENLAIAPVSRRFAIARNCSGVTRVYNRAPHTPEGGSGLVRLQHSSVSLRVGLDRPLPPRWRRASKLSGGCRRGGSDSLHSAWGGTGNLPATNWRHDIPDVARSLGLYAVDLFSRLHSGNNTDCPVPPIVLRLSAVCINMDACTFFAFLGGSVGSVLI
jgi:hypothetical protein